MVVRERLAPKRHSEVGVDGLRGLELLDRLVPPEAVKYGHPPQEMLLRLPGGRRGKGDRAHVVELTVYRRSHEQEESGEGRCFVCASHDGGLLLDARERGSHVV